MREEKYVLNGKLKNSHFQDLCGHETRQNVCLRIVKDRCGVDSSASR
jgi:hypothetical protein